MKEQYVYFKTGTHYFAIQSAYVVRIIPTGECFPLPIKNPIIQQMMLLDDCAIAHIDIEHYYFKTPIHTSKFSILVKWKGDLIGLGGDEEITTVMMFDHMWEKDKEQDTLYVYKEGMHCRYLLES